MRSAFLSCLIVLGVTGLAAAHPRVSVVPTAARPGDAVLVSVTGTKTAPKGKVGEAPLHFFASRTGYQALVAVPLASPTKDLVVEIDGVPQNTTVKVTEHKFPETNVIVEDEMANPPKADRDRIDADNKAIIDSFAKANDAPQFSRPFRRPLGDVTSTFGEWRTFNDGHKSQHLGLDLGAREGSKVVALNAGTVTLVRDCFLAGNTVVIVHGGGIASTYYHLSKVSVVAGDVVTQGKEIGLAGHTGRTTGPHLHLSIRVPGGFVDPAGFFKLPITIAAPTK